MIVADPAHVPADEWAQWEQDRHARNREHAALRARPVRPTKEDLEAQLEALRLYDSERVARLCRRVAQLELVLDQALRVHQALGRGRNDERVA